MASTLYLAAEETRDLPADPFVIGIAAFVVLLVLMAGLLVFGKGRPHT